MRLIRVLQFSEIINGGDFIEQIAAHLDTGRFSADLAVFTRSTNICPLPEQRPYRVWDLSIRSRSEYPRGVARLRRLVSSQGVDIVHAHHLYPAILTWLAVQGTRARWVFGRHYGHHLLRLQNPAKRQFYRHVERLLNRSAARIVVPTSDIAALLRQDRVPEPKVRVIPYILDLTTRRTIDPSARGETRAALGLPGPAVVTVGRLHEEKGHCYMLEALPLILRDFPDATWVVVGDGDQRQPLERRVTQLGVSHRVRFLGWRTDVPRILAGMDLMVHPSLAEGYPQVVIEALLAGIPVVATEAGGTRDVLQEGRFGTIVPFHNPGAIADATARWLNTVVGGWRERQAARQFAEALVSRDTIIPRFEALYREVVDERAGSR